MPKPTKKTISTQSLIAGGMFKGAKFGGNAFGGNKLTQIIKVKEEKSCPICQEVVGENYSNNCQCEKKDNRCEYCQTDQFDKKSCSCQEGIEKENEVIIESLEIEEENQQTSYTQALITGGEFNEAEFISNAFNNNKLHQIIGKNEKECRVCELEVSECQCEKENGHCEYCQGDSIEKKSCCCYLNKVGQSSKFVNSRGQDTLLTKIKEDIKNIQSNPQLVNKYLTIGNINIEQGHLLIDNLLGDNTSLSYINCQQEVLPK